MNLLTSGDLKQKQEHLANHPEAAPILLILIHIWALEYERRRLHCVTER